MLCCGGDGDALLRGRCSVSCVIRQAGFVRWCTVQHEEKQQREREMSITCRRTPENVYFPQNSVHTAPSFLHLVLVRRERDKGGAMGYDWTRRQQTQTYYTSHGGMSGIECTHT